jgi:glutaminyl-peptide cyclotransferase
VSRVLLFIMLVLSTACDRGKTDFDGEAALGYVRAQLEFGPRVPGSLGHRRTGDWITSTMRERADTVIEQRWTHVTAGGDSLPMRNILARIRPDLSDRILYIAHWDTRPISDDDPNPARRSLPVPGANDGASGVALLIALADALRKTPPSVGVDLLFVDGEDYGDFGKNQDVLIGSRYFAQNLPAPDYKPLFGVVWDMIGDAELGLSQEGHSVQRAPEVVARVWNRAADLGYSEYFVPRTQGPITDDHVPLLDAGLRVIDVIDLDYASHHTPDDTIDKVSSKSLQIVGDVALSLLR